MIFFDINRDRFQVWAEVLSVSDRSVNDTRQAVFAFNGLPPSARGVVNMKNARGTIGKDVFRESSSRRHALEMRMLEEKKDVGVQFDQGKDSGSSCETALRLLR